MDRTASPSHGLFAKEQRNIDSFAKIAATGARLSVTFRFQSGSDELDSRAVRDLDRLAEFLRSPAAVGLRVAILGFTDNRGSDFRNRKLSQDRAAAVANIVRQKGIKVDLFGGSARTAPVACNTSRKDSRRTVASKSGSSERSFQFVTASRAPRESNAKAAGFPSPQGLEHGRASQRDALKPPESALAA